MMPKKARKHDGDESRRHLQRIGFDVDEVAETFREHEKLSDDDADDGATDADAQSGENVGDGRQQSDGEKHLEICRGNSCRLEDNFRRPHARLGWS